MQRNVYLYAPNFVSGLGSVTTVWLPYTVGCLWSYAVTNPTVASNYRLAGLGVLRDPIEQVVRSLDNPAVCGFSTYVWNEQYNLQLAQAIKQRWPDCVIVFGGPNVPNQEQDYRDWRASAPWIDVTIRYEGEQAFQQMLLDHLSGDLKKDYVATRLEELDIPSPYLTGVFDSIVLNQSHQYAMTFETNRGCPFACTFCDWGSLTYSKIKKFPLERVFAEIDWAGRNQIEFVIIADANFGVFPDRDQAIVDHLIATKQQWGYPQQLNTNWYKNSNQVVLDIAEKLTQHGLNRGLTLSVQSMNDATLTAIKRKNMRINDLSTLFRDCNRRQIPFYTELILGLPLETLDSWQQGHYQLLEMGQHGCVFVFPVELLRNSELGINHQQYQIQSATIDDYWRCEVTGINEKQHIVMSHSTMTAKDHVAATMFSWMIVTFHHHGWTEIYARFLHSQGWSYQQIYSSLEQWLRTDEFFLAQINTIQQGVEAFYLHQQSTDYYGIWDTVRALFADRAQSCQRLTQWFLSVYTGELAWQVIELQQAFITDPNFRSKLVLTQPNNLLSVILEFAAELHHSEHSYEFCPTSQWQDTEEFMAYVVLRRKEGFGKNRIVALGQQLEKLC
jgi:putative methyltransferase